MDLDKVILWGSVILVMMGFGKKLKVIQVKPSIQCATPIKGCRVIYLPTKVYIIK